MAHGYLQQVPPKEEAVADRRAHARLETRVEAVLRLHGRVQRVVIHNVSRGGLKLEHAVGLSAGDVLTIELLNRRSFPGAVAWVVFPFTGLAFAELLSENDPLLFGSAQ